MTGIVKFYNQAKGFGFIKADGGGDFFVHSSGLVDEIKENDIVSFEVIEGKKGPQAVNVQVGAQ